MNRAFFFGFGYTASYLAPMLRADGWKMAGTTRSQEKANQMWDQGVEPHLWDESQGPIEAPLRVFRNVTHILHSMPPTPKGDPVLKHHFQILQSIAPKLKWYGYISTLSVYGDTHGELATEDFAPNPSTPRGKLRLKVEQRHRPLQNKFGLPLHIFRAGAIYGPGRSAIRRAATAEPQLVHKEGHVTSRIHVVDLAQIIKASMDNPNPGSIYNCVDDLPTGPEVPLNLAYDMLGKDKPPLQEYSDVKEDLPVQLNAMYQETRHISNAKIKSELGVQLRFPTYKEGYEALAQNLRNRQDEAS